MIRKLKQTTKSMMGLCGVYSITLGDEVYIAGTTTTFENRYNKLTRKGSPLGNEIAIKLLARGGEFNIVWAIDLNVHTDKEFYDKVKSMVGMYKNIILDNSRNGSYRYTNGRKLTLANPPELVDSGDKEATPLVSERMRFFDKLCCCC